MFIESIRNNQLSLYTNLIKTINCIILSRGRMLCNFLRESLEFPKELEIIIISKVYPSVCTLLS